MVGMVVASGRSWIVPGFCHNFSFGFKIQAQYNRIHVNWSKADGRADVSAESVLVTICWIFLVPQEIGLMTHDLFWDMSLWVATTIMPACDSGFVFEAKDASEKATNLKSLVLMGLILIVTSWCFLAVWSARVKVETVTLFIWDWRSLKALERSDRVRTAAYCREPMRPRSACLSTSDTGSNSWSLLSGVIVMGLMFFTYLDWENSLLLSMFWWMSIPVNVIRRDIFVQVWRFAHGKTHHPRGFHHQRELRELLIVPLFSDVSRWTCKDQRDLP